MLTVNQVEEIREFLNNAANPLFYFDNDQDGLSSYLLLKRYIGKGNGVPVKTSPLSMEYYHRIREFTPDIVFILDQPTVSKEFFDELEKEGIPVIWIDHHETNLEELPPFLKYYNPLYNEYHTNIPVTSLCYQISQKKEDLWLAVLGCIADKYVPEYYDEFLKKYPELGIKSNDAFEIFYNSEIGKIARMVGSGLKDRTTNVIKMIRYLSNVKTPNEILEENKDNHSFHQRFEEIDSKFKKLIDKAKLNSKEEVLVFKYSGETSMSADLANKLSYLYPKKDIIVAFIKGVRVNLSLRGKNIKEKALDAIKEFPLGTCGGHDDAVGAQLDLEELDKFIENFKRISISKE